MNAHPEIWRFYLLGSVMKWFGFTLATLSIYLITAYGTLALLLSSFSVFLIYNGVCQQITCINAQKEWDRARRQHH